MAAGKSGGSFAEKFQEVVDGLKNAVISFFTTSKEEQNPFQQLYVALCPYCSQPLLTTYKGCDGCQHHKIDPGTCRLPGCDKPAYFDVNTSCLHKFCGRTHANMFHQQKQNHPPRYCGHPHHTQDYNSHLQGQKTQLDPIPSQSYGKFDPPSSSNDVRDTQTAPTSRHSFQSSTAGANQSRDDLGKSSSFCTQIAVKDSRGVLRGGCSLCGCAGYDGGTAGMKCVKLSCGHPPAKHQNLTKSIASPAISMNQTVDSSSASITDTSTSISKGGHGPTRLYPGCGEKSISLKHSTSKDHVQQTVQQAVQSPTVGNDDDVHDTVDTTPSLSPARSLPLIDRPGIQSSLSPSGGAAAVPTDSSSIAPVPPPGQTGYNVKESKQRQAGVVNPKLKCKTPDHSQKKRKKRKKHVSTLGIRPANPQELSYVQAKFQQNWATRKSACPSVECVFVITNHTLQTRWQTYRQTLSDQTIEEHFHGTKVTCDIVTTQTLCTSQDCGVCGISSTGFDQKCIQQNISFQRFGHGFYLALNSSKCHDYTQGIKDYRAMLLCDVSPGNKYVSKKNKQTLKNSPQGYDSVHGQPGVNLNYEEIVLYQPDAILPRYIIVYKRDGIGKIAS